jgi:hypothetical protein
MTQRLFAIALVAGLSVLGTNATGQISITSGGGMTYNQDFDNLLRTTTAETWMNNANTSSANDSPRLIGLLGWYVAGYTATIQSTYVPQIRADAGSSTTGSFYSYGSSGAADRALGTLPSDSTTAAGAGSFRIGARFVNNTGNTITGFNFSYDGEEWRQGAVTAINNQYVVAYATFAAGMGTLDSGPYSASIATAAFNTPLDGNGTGTALDGNAAANRVAGLSGSVTGLSIANGDEIWLRWFDSNSSGADHGIAIDNFGITFEVAPIPEPSLTALVGLGLLFLIRRARA